MPVTFTCPHCGAQTLVADSYIGRTGTCASCGQQITVHGGAVAAAPGAPGRTSAKTIALVVVGTLLLLFLCMGLPALLMLPAIQAAREAQRGQTCQNNLRQIGSALLQYHADMGCFPPAYIADASGKPLHSWRVLILPYLDRKDLYDSYDFNEPWNGPKNTLLAPLVPPVYACPSDPDTIDGYTSYVAAVGPQRVFPGAQPRKESEITDGAANTIAVIEHSASKINWLEPRDGPPAGTNNATAATGSAPASNHPHQSHALFIDGSVHSLPDHLERHQLDALMTVDGGEMVPIP
jgi:predicted RNA-binding Zn-ribbon protein involved in translation (DUF1610 family)